MGAADVVFNIGSLSGAVASALEDLPSVHHRRKVLFHCVLYHLPIYIKSQLFKITNIVQNVLLQMAQHRLSVVIVDRTLDLCVPLSVDSKCFLDKILCSLPHIPDQTNDVAVNMSQLAQVTV